MINKINSILAERLDKIIIYREGKACSQREFVYDIAKNYLKAKNSDSSAILYCSDSYNFMVGFFALLCAKRHIVIPSNINITTLDTLKIKDVFTDTNIKDKEVNIFDLTEGSSNDNTLPTIANGKLTFYTSGSTGTPKKIEKTLHNLAAENNYLAKLLKDVIEQNPVVVSTVSISHMYGIFYGFLLPLSNNLAIEASTVLSPEILQARLNKFKKVFMVSSPAFMERVTNYADEYKFDTKPLFITSSGGLLSNKGAERVYAMLRQNPMEIFGSTETGGVAYRVQRENPLWSFMEGVEGFTDDLGRLGVKSDFIDTEYIMGDLVEITPEKKFILKGRADRMVKFHEKRVSLEEIEKNINEHPYIKRSYALLLSDKNSLCACLALNNEGKQHIINKGKSYIIDSVKEHLKDKVDRSAIPSKWRIIEEFPVNSQSKIKVGAMQNLFYNNIAEPVVINKNVKAEEINLNLIFLKDSIYFEGHFPRFPLLPGVIQLHLAVHWAKVFWSINPKVNKISKLKFTKIILPQSEINLTITKEEKSISFKYYKDEYVYSSGTIMLNA